MKRKPDAAIVKILNEVLTGELTAINQYFLHAKLCGDWGYQKLHDIVRKESIEEMEHAEWVIERILFLNGVPNVQRMFKVNIGETVKEQFELDLKLEFDAVPRLKKGIELCLEKEDHVTRELLERILKSEEDHIDWLETQLTLIEQVGLQNYLATQIGG